VLRLPSEVLTVADGSKTIREGALAVTRASGGALNFPRASFDFLGRVAEANGFDLDTAWDRLPEAARLVMLFGTGEERYTDSAAWDGKRRSGSVTWQRRWPGVIPALRKAWKSGSRRRFVERFLDNGPCPDCDGTRLNELARAVEVGGVRFADLVGAPVAELPALLDGLVLDGRRARIAEPLLVEIRRRLGFLEQVGLSYLSLDRAADTLSGGEAQRIRLAAQLGAGLQGVLYVLDEPSIGLHARDHGRLLGALLALRDAGNTVVVVEHDEATLRAADHLIDIGPGPGCHGGRVVAAGTPAEVAAADSPTGKLLRGEIEVEAPDERRLGDGRELSLRGARGHNLKGVDVTIPLGTLVVVTGVSGSGKSSLVHHTLQRALARHLGLEAPVPLAHDALLGVEAVEELVFLSSAPIGRTPRSNPATYTGAFTPIRDLFASLPEARMRGWAPGRFSFNVAGGRCEVCQGAGAQFVELQFLAPVTVPCPECGGHRFRQDTLEVHYKGHSIADVLGLTVEEAYELFRDLPKVARPLAMLVEVGLGYLQLGQPSTTLSGGEAQRVKLAKRLQRRSRKHTVYLLDEPTTGLHGQDVARLVSALQRLVDQGNTVVVIEHNLDVVRASDHVIDLGPDGGEAGGHVLLAGSPSEVERCTESATGLALRRERRHRTVRAKPAPAELVHRPRTHIEVVGARTHNLKGVDVDIPRGTLTVVTGPSGSGKSSLALDTIHAMGRQRFVESLSTYARQFLTTRDRPPVERLDGLGPSVAVEGGVSGAHPRSTVATTTEIHDHLRVLWSRAGTPRCPEHGERLERSDPAVLARRIVTELEGQRGWIVAPMFGPGAERPADLEQAFAEAAAEWQRAGYVRVLVDGVEVRLAGFDRELGEDTRVDLVIDRVGFSRDSRSRVAEALEQAEVVAGGRASVVVKSRARDAKRLEVSSHGACTLCGYCLPEDLEPRHFSFNTHVGACPECDGLGEAWRCDADKLVDQPGRALIPRRRGSSTPKTAISSKLGRYLTKGKGYYEHLLRRVAKVHRIDLTTPVAKLSDEARELLLFGTGARDVYDVKINRGGATWDMEEDFSAPWPGLCGHVDAWHARSEDPEWSAVLQRVMRRSVCRSCDGERLAPAPRAMTLGRKRLPEVLSLSVRAVVEWLERLRLPAARRAAVEPVLAELSGRVGLLDRVGLGYLTLDRRMSTLSGGESRRVQLSASLGSQLVGVCYVLDEPTVGLHPADVDRLTDALLELRDGGNTVLVVEHDESLMRRADHLVELGPGAGVRGGEVVASATPAEVERSADTLTGRALRGELRLDARRDPQDAPTGKVGISGARLHNLRNLSFEARFGELLGVCGPSGSGKSTLVLECLVPALRGDERERGDRRWKRLRGAAGGGWRVVVVDASPLGRTPSSVPATAVDLLDPLRDLWLRTPDARQRGFTRSHFSFNSTKGRCPACDGRGATRVEMQFLADLWLTCEECDGKRYRPEVLEVKHRGRSLADVLAMTVDEALEFLEHVPAAARILRTLVDVGLGYLELGQSSTTLSAGEAQRVKLAAELLRATTGRSVVVLDEPTTGLHKNDVRQLYAVLRRLADRGDAVVVIEHHTDLLAACDRLLELGPGGGEQGGRVIAEGTPAELARDPSSVTGRWLTIEDGTDRAVRAARKKPRKSRKKVAS
jgi:excinuclease ABC subunit A